jgi:hypothetical protein
MRRSIQSLAVVLGCALIAATPADDTAHLIRFNTTCAHCHEGQCSGRLSFALAPAATFAHIRRYAGQVDEADARRLYDALAYMKRACAYPPLAVLGRHSDDPAALAVYRDAVSGDYFVPVGPLAPGPYRLRLDLAAADRLEIEVLNHYFELVAQWRSTVAAPRVDIRFAVEEQAQHFVRLRPAAAGLVLALHVD